MKVRITISNSRHVSMYVVFFITLKNCQKSNTIMHNNSNMRNKNRNKYMQNFTLFQNFADSYLKNDTFFHDHTNSRLPLKKYPFFAKMGTGMMYGLVACVCVYVCGLCVCVWGWGWGVVGVVGGVVGVVGVGVGGYLFVVFYWTAIYIIQGLSCWTSDSTMDNDTPLYCIYRKISNISRTKFQNLMILVSSCGCLCAIHWSQVSPIAKRVWLLT